MYGDDPGPVPRGARNEWVARRRRDCRSEGKAVAVQVRLVLDVTGARWADLHKNGANGSEKVLAAALAHGTIVGYGDDENQMHSVEGFTHNIWWQAKSLASLMKVLERIRKGTGSSSPLLASSTRRWDQIYISRFYNRKAGAWKATYGYTATYKLKPDAPEADHAVRALSSFYVPIFEKMLADGVIVEYEIDREMIHSTEARPQIHFSFVMPDAEGLDRFRTFLNAALDANSLLAPAFGSMMANFTPQADFVKVNASYKWRPACRSVHGRVSCVAGTIVVRIMK